MFKLHLGKIKNVFKGCINTSFKYTTNVENKYIKASYLEWLAAKPFKSIPGPTVYQMFKDFMPGGRFHKKSFIEFNSQLRSEYGDIYRLPGFLGKRDIVFTHNLTDFKAIYRTEGPYPLRRGLDVLSYHRLKLRKHIFQHAPGLVATQGEDWKKFRSVVGKPVLDIKIINLYLPQTDHVAKRFIKCIKNIRDPKSQEVPENFIDYMKYWTMNSVALIALNTDLNMIEESEKQPKAKFLLNNIKELFQLLLELDAELPTWKIIPTKKYKRCIHLLDLLNEFALEYVVQTIERLKTAKKIKPEQEQNILERLINKDPLIALTMAMDIFLAGTDTTTSALTSCLLCLAKNPKQQETLRQQIKSALPHQDTPLTVQNSRNNSYLRACIKESLRMYPVTSSHLRGTGRNVVLSGYRVPASTDVSMIVQSLLKDPKYFEQPDKFLPERWLQKADLDKIQNICPVAKADPHLFKPFGHGIRICIGHRIVNLALEVILTRLMQNFEIQFDYSTDDIFESNLIYIPAKPLKFKFIDLKY